MADLLIGALNRVRVPEVRSRGRVWRDFSGVIRGGIACRALVDRELEQRLAGEKAVADADATYDAPVRGPFGTLEWAG